MAASKSTVERVLEVILKHVPKETALKILEELMTVPGVPRYHRADVQPCASTVIATIPSEATRGARAVRDAVLEAPAMPGMLRKSAAFVPRY